MKTVSVDAVGSTFAVRLAVRLAVYVTLCLAVSPASAEAVSAELAGEALGRYPHFHHVRNFNSDEAIQVAVDPFRFSQLVGSNCHLYIVEDRSEIGWTLDRSLIDVRPGGHQPVSIGAPDIQSNTFVAAEAGLLDSDAGAGLGVGYDVVLDCNSNGVLDDGDLIDGRGDEPGLYAVHDTTQPGPLAVTEVDYSGGFFLTQRAYYPTDIASMGRLPIVVVSHGLGHDYSWYGHIGQHLASYGYVVMAHRNDVGFGDAGGTLSAGMTTLTNTDHILGNLGTIAGGVLDGHVDSHRIVFIGHSTGAEGVVRAYTLLDRGNFVPANFSTGDIVLVTSMAPVSFLPDTHVDPAEVNYFLILGAADTDTQNAPVANYMQPASIFERSRGNRQFVYMHGVGHEWLHSADTDPFAEGPDLIGEEETHKIMRDYFLPAMELYAKDNLAGRDFFTRGYDDYHPMAIDTDVVIANEYRAAESSEPVVVDDYQSDPAIGTSSSGGAVTFSVSNVTEILMQDLDGSLDWTGAQPSNGMTRARFPSDDTSCVMFDWSGGTAFYELAVPQALRNVADQDFISFRAAQGTRHPETVIQNSPLNFTIELRDGAGAASSINFSDYGRITRPYPRTGYGTGTGWANEFNTIRVPLADFTHNGSGLDLSDISTVRFNMGLQFGGKQGRVALDDVEFVQGFRSAPFHLEMSVAGGVTSAVWPAAVGAQSYQVYRGTIPAGGFSSRGSGDAVYDHSCFESADTNGDGARVLRDTDSIPDGQIGFYYLVSAVRSEGEGSLGLANVDLDPATPGVQIERPNEIPCP